MQKNFDVLDKESLLPAHCLIEASAGTGKTFTIAHLAVRLLLERQLPIASILLITFTRAAARELKTRFRSILEQQIGFLKNGDVKQAPAYLFSGKTDLSLQILERALIHFEEAAIYTIHGCCERMLNNAPLGLVELRSEGIVSGSELVAFIEQYIREEVNTHYSLEEVKELLKEGVDAVVIELEKILNGSCHEKTPLWERLAKECSAYIEAKLEEREKYRYDDLLKLALKASFNEEWVSYVRSTYKVAIIDEFQDTDAPQWEIFRRLFLYEGGLLYLVGDPKQSIYAFRQADIYTYLEAAQCVGNRVSLRRNFRSEPALVCAMNDFFCKVHNLFPLPKTDSSLEYEEVLYKGELHAFSAMKVMIVEAKKGRARKWPTQEVEEELLFPYIAGCILEAKRNKNTRFGAWAILIRDKHQAQSVGSFLQRYGIAVQQQKVHNVADSKVLSPFKEFLEALERPKDKGIRYRFLMGAFMRYTVEEALSADHERILDHLYQLKRLFNKEGIVAAFNAWLRLDFEGATPLQLIQQHPEGDIFLRDLNYVVQILAQEKAELKGLIHYLDRFEALRLSGDKRLEIASESRADAVHILTMHMSKGLEFDYVIPLGIINRTKEEADNEVEAEKMRQLYVALTRAKKRLYLIVLLQTETKLFKNEAYAPLELFLLAALKERAFERKAVEALFASCRFTQLVHEWRMPTPYSEEKKEQTVVAKQVEILPQKSFLLSFTSLTKNALPLEESREGAPTDFSCVDKTVQTLPAGAYTGVLVHRLMERLDFKQALDKDYLSSYIAQEVAGSPFEGWQEALISMVHKAVTVEFLEGGAALSSVVHTLRESSFLYNTIEGHWMKGVADLLFLHRGRYYLLDWKTHSLADYTQQTLQHVMEKHNYFLQAQIYEEALRRYLALVEKRPFEEIFGGTYYFFMRGGAIYRVGTY